MIHLALKFFYRLWTKGLVFCFLFIQPACALIVVDGKVVGSWPEPNGSQQSAAGIASSVDPGNGRLAKPSAAVVHQYPHPSGPVWGLTLLVDFSDQTPAFSQNEINSWLNEKGFNRFNCKGSVRDYYLDISNGKVDFQNEVHGFYRAKNPKSYYEGVTDYSRAAILVDEIMAYFDSTVDFSKFDNDKDGTVESISIVYAGSGVKWGQGIWPHAGGINQKRDDVKLTRYMMTDLGSSFGLYVFCHECGHMLFGWPDLYGVGDYCLMANRMSEGNPVPVNDFYRADQGWMDIVDIDKNTNAYFTAPANSTSGFRYINPARPDECFFWSNWKNVNRRSTLKGKGLLVWHFDKAIGTNDPPKTLSMAVVQADGKGDLNKTTWPDPGSDAADYFYQGNGTSFGPQTVPPANWNNGLAAGLVIHDISAIADTMSFQVGTGAVAIRLGSGDPGREGIGSTIASPTSKRFDLNGRQSKQGLGKPGTIQAGTINQAGGI